MLAVAVALDHFMELAATETLAAVEWGVMEAVQVQALAAVAVRVLEIMEHQEVAQALRAAAVLEGVVTA
jgi:hypothetical protein